MPAHIIGRDSEAGCREVIDLLLPLGCILSPAVSFAVFKDVPGLPMDNKEAKKEAVKE